MSDDSLIRLRDALRAFAEERDWAQFHNPKNLAMALTGEVGELVEHFQWLSAEQSAALDPATRREVALEMADVLLYLVRMADTLGIDLAEVAGAKLAINAERYPVERARGTSKKYDRL
ncbi:nucleotide pyrophosphohydrolase [Pseudazoarcus pumilus]|nr:nucleotide pyrophosphohydrolase [Pseudazoarcus pumilus]